MREMAGRMDGAADAESEGDARQIPTVYKPPRMNSRLFTIASA
jgi:hypothetical protein